MRYFTVTLITTSASYISTQIAGGVDDVRAYVRSTWEDPWYRRFLRPTSPVFVCDTTGAEPSEVEQHELAAFIEA